MRFELDPNSTTIIHPETLEQPFPPKSHEDLAADHLNDGIKAARAGDRQSARHSLLRAVELDPQNEAGWLWLSSISEYPEELLTFLTRVLEINPSNERAMEWAAQTNSLLSKSLVQRGIDAAESGEPNVAGSHFQRAIEHDDRNSVAWLWLASLESDDEKKGDFFEKVLEIEPDNEIALNGIAEIRSRVKERLLVEARVAAVENRQEECVSLLNSINDKYPDWIDAWLLKAHTVADFHAKLDVFRTVLNLDPENQEAKACTETIEAALWAKAVEREAASEPVQETSAENPQWVDASGELPIQKPDEVEPPVTEPDWGQAETAFDPSKTIYGSALETKIEWSQPEADLDPGPIESYIESAPIAEPEWDQHAFGSSETNIGSAPETKIEWNAASENQGLSVDSISSTASFDDFQVEDPDVEEISYELDESDDPNPQAVFNGYPVEEVREESNSVEQENELTNGSAYHVQDEEIPAPDSAFNSADSDSDTSSPNTLVPIGLSEEVREEIDNYEFSNDAGSSRWEAETESDHTSVERPETPSVNFDQTMTNVVPFNQPRDESSAELGSCPFCSHQIHAQTFTCPECRSVLTLSDLELLLANQNADKDVLRQAILLMEREAADRELDEKELTDLAIGHLNLRNLQYGYEFLRKASQKNPNNVVLSSQVNALLIRLGEIKEQEATHSSMARGKTILVVDDSPTVRKLITSKLEKCGHEVHCSSDGDEAISRLEELRPDLILLDINMPRMDGYQACKLIRSNPAIKDVPVVMISGKDGFFDKVRGRMVGTSGYITKPFGPEALMKAVEFYLNPNA